MGKMYRNMKIRSKILLIFIVIIVFVDFISFFGLKEIQNTNSDLKQANQSLITPIGYIYDVDAAYTEIRLCVLRALTIGDDSTLQEKQNRAANYEAAKDNYLKEIEKLREYLVSVDADVEAVDTMLNLYEKEYLPVSDKVIAFVVDSQHDEGQALLPELTKVSEKVQQITRDYIANGTQQSSETIKHIRTTSESMTVMILVLLFVANVIMLLICLALFREIKTKFSDVITQFGFVAQGDFSQLSRSDGTDEISELNNKFVDFVDVIKEIIDDLRIFGEETAAGNMTYKIVEEKYEGDYKEVITTVNFAMKNIVIDVRDFLEGVNQVGSGQFDYQVKEFAGQKRSMNVALDKLKENLNYVNNEINIIVEGLAKGDMNVSVDDSKAEGAWQEMLQGLNNIVNNVNDPISDALNVLVEMEQGNLSARMNGEYSGIFNQIKQTLNNSMTKIEGYINVIDKALNQVKNNDLSGGITEMFDGDFVSLKLAINKIIEKLNDVFREFLIAAGEVSIGAQQIANNSISLADGATDQVTALNLLTRGVDNVSESSHNNAENAIKANEISEISKQNAIKGDEQMKQMLVSMNEISESSGEISNIIKVIEDIAFQTNLLALNAAVEAARAGNHGKGFAVVAEEVRTLAARSSEAAKETTELIKTSISRVEQGSELAKDTAFALDEIVANVSEIASLIENISTSSSEQSKAVSKINEEIKTVENVVVNTSAVSQEGVSTAEELSSQSVVLRELIATFKLKQE